jgi:hypothetical protein
VGVVGGKLWGGRSSGMVTLVVRQGGGRTDGMWTGAKGGECMTVGRGVCKLVSVELGQVVGCW